jgi:2-keto-4-pentenoate hydratase/2-oxohepta-3-ene-1,7-dioic acid hydratase in catechol pathway
MKLLRYGPVGQEKPGCLDKDGNVRDLSGKLDDITADTLSPAGLEALKAIDVASLPVVKEPGRIGTPYAKVGKFLCVGLNYSDHAAETGAEVPAEPILFTKWSEATGPNDNIVLPQNSVKTDWEVELGVVIGTKARYVSLEDALNYVAGYCVVNDVSEREYQIERSGGQWSKGKGFDRFGPIGPWLVTRDEVPDPQALQLWLDVNGERRQSGSTRTMIFGCAELVSHCSRVMTLEPGDLIITGTPPGVGMGMKPPRYLKAGDVMELGVEGLGVQRQRVV